MSAVRALRQRLSIRTRIAGGSLLIAVLIAVAAGIVFAVQIERIVRDGTTAVLASDSAPYVAALTNEPDDAFDPPGPSQLVSVVGPDGRARIDTLPAALSAAVPGLAASVVARDVVAGDVDYVVLTTTVDVAGEEWRVVAARDGGEEATVLGQMRVLLFSGLAVIALGAAGTAWVLTTVALGPVRRLRTSAEALSDSSTTELLDVGPAEDEISELARTLNDLIERLRESADRERQLVSDASHELRTPIAILNTQLQVAVAEASSVEQMVSDVQGAQRNVARLSALVTSLLELSAIESTGGSERVDLMTLDREAADAVDRAEFRSLNEGRKRARGADVVIKYAGPEPIGPQTEGSLTALIRAEDFGRVLDNLLGNALRAVGEHGSVDVDLRHTADSTVLVVSDTGGGMDPGFAPTAFDRFSRQDSSRAGRDGAGLGLAIVAAIVRNAHGSIMLDNHPGTGLTVTVELPLHVD